jgi:glycosyltransferase involved in cell wall biosynthesis
MIKKMTYISTARLPTEKAHGYQICKMCEAFADCSVEIILLHPHRKQIDSALCGQSIFEYYGIYPNFRLETLFGIHNLRGLGKFLPQWFLMLLLLADNLLWGLYAALTAAKENADLYYTRDSSIAFWLAQLGLPTAYEAHGIPKRGGRWLLHRLARHPALQLTVVLTTYIKKELVAMGFPSEKILVQPDGADLSLFEDLPAKETCRERLRLPQNRPTIGYIGRFQTLEMEKGIPELVQATARLSPIDGKEPLLLCVGGPMEVVPTYLEIARRFNIPEHRLEFRDRVPNREVPLWMRSCDVVTIPWQWTEFSAYYTSPMKLFEYMAAGVPIVASDLPSIREVLRHGENAWLVKPGEPDAIAKGIQIILENPPLANQLSRQACLDVRDYTWRQRANRILNGIQAL